MTKYLQQLVLIAALALCGLMSTTPPAMANITITPTRVVFEGRDRFADVFLVNTGSAQKTYEMSWEFYEMQEEGTAYKSVESSVTDFDLSKHVVFTPRRVTLAPGAKQRVRLALRRPPGDIPDGDYRAHLTFGGVKTPPPPGDDQENESGQQRASASVSINVGYSIPVIFRAGEPNEGATIQSLQLKKNRNGGLTAVIDVHRAEGPYSVMGHLFIYHVTTDGREDFVGEIGNAHIFPEVNRRVFEFPLQKEGIRDGAIKIVLKHYEKERNYVYDEKIFPVQGR